MFYLRMQTRGEFCNKKQQNSVLSGAKHVQVICGASWHSLFPCHMVAVAAGWTGPAAAHWGKHYICIPEVEACTQIFQPQAVWTVLPQPLALGSGVFKHGITTAVQAKALCTMEQEEVAKFEVEYNGSLFVIFHLK